LHLLQKAAGNSDHPTVAADLVVLSATLNGSGLQICSAVKDDNSLGFVPIIVLLEKASDRIEVAFECGADEVLVEPVQKSVLLSRINALLRIKRRFDALRQQNQALTNELSKRTQELEFALHESQTWASLKDSIVTNVSHELRTPLLQVKSAVAMLAEDARAANKGVSIIADHATAATGRLESAVQNITQLASTLNVKSSHSSWSMRSRSRFASWEDSGHPLAVSNALRRM